MIKKTAFLLLVLFFGATQLFGQARTRYQEYGLGVGTLNTSGDIATTTNTAALLEEMRPNFMVFAQYHFNDWFTMGVQTSFGWTYMNDENHGNPNRGIENTTQVVQVNPYLQMHFIRFGKYRYSRKFTAYVKAGAGFLAYDTNPRARRVFGENTQEFPDAYSGVSYFYGLGVKIRATRNSTLSLETTIHNSTTDNFDGIAVQSATQANDYFGGVMLKYGFMIF